MSPPFDGYLKSGNRKGGAVPAAPPFRRKLLFEALEPRLLLSADITYSSGVTDPALDLTLKFSENAGADVVQLINNDGGTVIDQKAMPADHVINVNITGGQFQDTLIIDFGFAGAQDGGPKPTLNVTFDGGDELLPTDLSPIAADLLKIQNSGGMFTLAGLDIHSTEATQIVGSVTVEGNLDIAVMGVDAAQYASLFDLVHADSVGTIDMMSGDVIADSVSLTASSTLDLNVTGFGLSIAQIAILDGQSLARVTVQGGSITTDVAGISLGATSLVTAHSTPTSDANKNAADQDAAVASVTLRSDALAKVFDDASIHAAGKLDITASNTVVATATADGSKGGAGATFGLGLVFTNTEASIGDTATVDHATAISLTADSHNTVDVMAKSTPRGASDEGGGETRTQKGLANPDGDAGTDDAAGTSDGKLTLAGALAVTGLRSDTHAFITTTGAMTTTGAVTLSASSENHTSAKADGTSIINADFDPSAAVDASAETIQLAADHNLHTGDKVTYHHGDGGADINGLTDGNAYYVRVLTGNKVELYDTQTNAKAASGTTGREDLTSKGSGKAHSLELDPSATGVSVAVAINVAKVNTTANLAGSNITAGSISLKALVSDNVFSAEAISGAGDASKTGFAGALAINIGLTTASATIADNVNVALTGGSGDVALEAQNHVTNTAKASASQAGSAKTGVGASVALNIGETDTNALIGAQANLTGAHNLKLDADSINAMTTAATGGSKGGTAVTPVVAISVADNDTNAKLGALTGTTLLSGALEANASHKGSVDTEATGDTKSGKTGVGISLALSVATDRAIATTARNIDAGGAVSFRARSVSFSSSRAKASVAGGEDTPSSSKDSKDQGGGISNAVHNQSNFADTRGGASGTSSKSADQTDGKSAAEGQSGSVQVAGAVGVTVAVSHTDTSIPDGRDIKAGSTVADGALTLRSQNNTDAAASADASAVVVNVQKFDATTGKDVSATDDTITLQSKHGLSTGDKVTFRGGDDIGLADKTTYYVNIDGDTAKLYDTEDHAKAGKADGLEDLKIGTGDSYTLTAGTGGGTGVGISVAVNVADIHNTANVGNSKITADGLTAEALVPAVVRDGVTGGTTVLTFDPSAVDASSDDKTDKDTITVAGADGLESGDAVLYHKGSGELIGGLADNTTYFAIVQADGSIKLADTQKHALSGDSINLTSAGTGTGHKLEYDRLHTPGETVVAFDAAAGGVVDTSANTIDLGDDTHGLRTGDAVVYRNGDGANTDIGGLNDGKSYSVIALADGKIQLAGTDGKAIDLTSSGTGSGHRLVFDRAHTLSAEAHSGASGGDTGVAGALAINVGISHASASVADSATLTMTDGGNVSLVAENFVVNAAQAKASQADATKTGVGASIVLNIGETHTDASVGDFAIVSGAHDLKLSAASSNHMTTRAEGGAGGATAVTPVIAITVSDNHTSATLGALASGEVKLTGALEASAAHDGSAETVAEGDTKSEDTGVGVSIALTVAIDSAIASTARNIDAGGAVSFSARTTSANKSEAKASVAGGEDKAAETKDKSKDQGSGISNLVHNQSSFADDRGSKAGASGKSADNTDGKGTGDTANGSVQVAGAVGVTVAITDARATIANVLTVKSGGVLTLKAENNTDAVTSADGSAKTDKTGTGVGIAVGVNVGVVTNEAALGNGADITAAGLKIEASGKDNFSASAISGASKGDTGVAGSLAVNVGISRTAAKVDDNASVTITGGKDVELTASNTVSNSASAKAKQEGAKNFGMGASIAVNIGETDTNATVGDLAVITDAGGIKLDASSGNTLTTSAVGGAKGDTAITPVVAVAVSNNDTNATLGTLSSGELKLDGALSVSASHKGSAETVALGDTESGDTGVGISIALTVAVDNATASTARSVNAGGAVGFSARMVSPSDSRAVASVAGGDSDESSADSKSKDGKDQGGGVNNQIHNQTNAADTRANKSGAEPGTTGKTDGKTSDTSGKDKNGSSAVQVAGAVGVTVAISHSQAIVGDGLKIQSGAAFSLKADNNTDAIATGDGAATTDKGGTGVGIGVAVNYAEVTNTATVGAGATVIANGLSMEAAMADRAVSVATSKIDIVDYKEDSIFVGADNGLHTGDKIKYQQSEDKDSKAIGGLTDNTDYYVIDAGNGKIKLAADETKAHAGTAIDLTALSGTDKLGAAHKFERSGLLGTGLFAGDAIVFDPAGQHRLLDLGKGNILHTGDAVTYQSAAGTADDIGGLADDTTYYVIRLDDNTADLAATRENALAGKAIALTSAGTGNAHKLIDTTGVFRAEAKSGASGGDTGVAGSVAVNIAQVTNEAVVRGGAAVTLGGGDVDLKAASTTDSIATAVPRASGGEGKSLGVGASVAVNIDIEHARAEVEDGVAFTTDTGKTLGHATVDVSSGHVLQTDARAGASSSSGNAIGGAVAITYGEHHTTARLGDGTNLKLSGNLDVSATHAAKVNTTVDSEASGKNAGIGVSIAVAIGIDETRAAVGGAVDAGGTATVVARHSLLSETTAKGSAKGADGDAKKDDGKGGTESKTADDETKTNVDYTNSKAGSKVESPSANDQIGKGNDKAAEGESKDNKSGSKSGEGSKIKVAAAIGVTVLDSRSSAEIENGANIKSGGALKVSSTNETDATTKAIGLALSQGGSDSGSTGGGGGGGGGSSGGTTGVAAGISVNVGIIHNTARIGDLASVQSSGVIVEAITPAGKSDDFIVWGIAGAGAQQSGSSGSSTAVAGGVGVNVVTMDTLAEIADSADVRSSGKIEVTARGDIGVQNIAAAGAAAIGGSSGGGAAVGAAVAVNVVLNNTTARIGTADVDAAGAISVESDASIEPLALLNQPVVFDVDVSPLTISSVDTTDNTVTLGQAQFSTGDEVVYDKGDAGNSEIGGLTNGGHYFVRTEAGTKIALYDTNEHARAGGSEGLRDLTSAGTGIAHSLKKVVVDTNHDTIALEAPQFTSGDEVVYRKGADSNSAIGGLVDDGGTTSYFVRVEGDGGRTISLYDTKDHAKDTAHTAGRVDLTSAGSGGGHSLKKTGFNPQVTTVAVGGGVSQQGNGVAGSFAVDVFIDHTHAVIADNAQINQRGLYTATAGQSVSVQAEDRMHTFDLAGALAGSLNSSGFGAAVNVQVLVQDTEASIGNSTDVKAGGDVSVQATATQDQFAIAANIGASKDTAVGGAIAVLVSDNHTRAFIGDSATVDADGNVIVQALQDTDMHAIAGNAGVSTSSSAFGLSVTVFAHVDDVEAYIGDNAHVTARGKWADTQVQTGEKDSSGSRTTEGARGLALTATSFENIFTIAAGFSGGSSVGIGGSVVVNVLDENTQAWIGERSARQRLPLGRERGTGRPVARLRRHRFLRDRGCRAVRRHGRHWRRRGRGSDRQGYLRLYCGYCIGKRARRHQTRRAIGRVRVLGGGQHRTRGICGRHLGRRLRGEH